MKYLTAVIILGIVLGISLKDKVPALYVYKPPTAITMPQKPPPNVDELVDKYSKRYGITTYTKNRTKALLHFLLLREQNYGGSNNCGDSGKACGPLQFHAATYEGYRKIMIKRGLVTELGSRLDMEDAIETCAWAINDGREEAWGPVARGEIKL
jgi:hypothetical protein